MKNLKYLHLKFTVSFLHNCRLPKYKTGTITGALIGRLKKLYCVYRNCNTGCVNCDYSSVCSIFNMMGRGFNKNMPLAMQDKVLPGFYINCSDLRTDFNENDTLEFDVAIFEKLTESYVLFIFIFETIGESGLGPYKAQYKLLSVSDEGGEIVFKDSVLLKKPLVNDIHAYITSRKVFLNNVKNTCRMFLLSPLALFSKNFNEFDEKMVILNAKSLAYTIKERLSSLDLLQKEDEEKLNELANDEKTITMINMKFGKIKYYIQINREYVIIPYFRGYVLFDAKRFNYWLEYLIACEKLCIGRNILLGFGRYIMR